MTDGKRYGDQRKETEKKMLYSSSAWEFLPGLQGSWCHPGGRQAFGNLGDEVGLSFMKKLLPGS